MRMDRWTFLTNHAHVLLCIWSDAEVRLRDIAAKVGITERATQRIVSDLIDGGYLTSRRVGRCNIYEVHPNLPFRHPIENHHNVGEFLRLMRAVPGVPDAKTDCSSRSRRVKRPAPLGARKRRKAGQGED